MAINLIPPPLKHQKEINYIFNQIVFGLFILLFMLGIMVLALFIYDSSIKEDIIKSQNRLSDQEKNLKDYKSTESSLKSINQKLLNIDGVLKEKVIWSEILARISGVTPKTVQVKTMDLYSDSSKTTISGVAVTRKDIAIFKEELEKNSFNNVVFTSSSYNQNTDDYTFSLSFELEGKK